MAPTPWVSFGTDIKRAFSKWGKVIATCVAIPKFLFKEQNENLDKLFLFWIIYD